MAKVTPARHAMALLERWPENDSLSTPEIIAMAGDLDHAVIYRWMMKLATYGYFRRDNDVQPRGGKLIKWTITPKGRATARELQGEPA